MAALLFLCVAAWLVTCHQVLLQSFQRQWHLPASSWRWHQQLEAFAVTGGWMPNHRRKAGDGEVALDDAESDCRRLTVRVQTPQRQWATLSRWYCTRFEPACFNFKGAFMFTVYHPNQLDLLKTLTSALDSQRSVATILSTGSGTGRAPDGAMAADAAGGTKFGIAANVAVPCRRPCIWDMFTRVLPDIPERAPSARTP